MPLPKIEKAEFARRLSLAQQSLRRAGLDALLVHGNEAEMASVRYFSDYWPIFESAGVLIPAEGGAALLIGPESETFAADRSTIATIHKMIEYREPADPEYPGIEVAGFKEVLRRHCGALPKKLGISGWTILPMPVWSSLRQALGDAEIAPCESVVRDLRAIKSSAEVACLAAAFDISAAALKAVLAAMRPGMTELELVGVAQQAMYARGAEYEGMPQYVLSGRNTAHAISRPTHRRIGAGELVQLNISARVGGYSSGIGRPACLGSMSGTMAELVDFGLEAHRWTIDHMQPGASAGEVARQYERFVRQRGYEEYMLYGPCHGLGMIEVEPPWLEKTSDYELQPGMAFQADTFFYTPPDSRLAADGVFGLRWEDGLIITDSGNRLLSDLLWERIEVQV